VELRQQAGRQTDIQTFDSDGKIRQLFLSDKVQRFSCGSYINTSKNKEFTDEYWNTNTVDLHQTSFSD